MAPFKFCHHLVCIWLRGSICIVHLVHLSVSQCVETAYLFCGFWCMLSLCAFSLRNLNFARSFVCFCVLLSCQFACFMLVSLLHTFSCFLCCGLLSALHLCSLSVSQLSLCDFAYCLFTAVLLFSVGLLFCYVCCPFVHLFELGGGSVCCLIVNGQ